MEEQMRLSYMRHTCSVQGWALMVYLLIMNVAVMLVMVIDSVGTVFASVISGMDVDLEQLTEQLMEGSGWGYFLAIGIGRLALMSWKKADFCCGTIWTRGKPMRVGSFLGILSIFVSGQLVFQLVAIVLELILTPFGVSYLEAVESTAISTDSLSMFLYVGLGAPISEEILFRGLILRSLEPFGKKFTIFASALLFGMFHGNLVQAPYAFAVGLVLGYVALEYSIIWAMVLHMFNNLILSDTLVRLTSDLPNAMGDWIIWGVILAFSIVAVVVLVVKRSSIAAYCREDHDDPLCARAFFTAPGIVTALVILSLSIVGTMVSTLFLT